MKPWYFGNTTVRSPFRLRSGLLALAASPLQGNIRGVDQEKAFCQVLGEAGVVDLQGDITYSIGRKWRSALSKLGFLFPKIPNTLGVPQSELGPIDTITPNGWRLIRADTVPGMQECFLRAMAAHFIPNALETGFTFSVFSPLRYTLAVMLELERETGESRIYFNEMAAIVQLTNSGTALATVVATILSYRDDRLLAANKKRYDREYREAIEVGNGYAAGTFKDYGDVNLRYLKATGLVQGKGRGIALVPGKHVFIEALVQDTSIPPTALAYLVGLCAGATLPTDNLAGAKVVLADLVAQASTRGLAVSVAGKPADTPGDIEILRHELEGALAEADELGYATRQASQWEEIAAYMELIGSRSSAPRELPNGDEIFVPKDEAPAYFEWVLWRAFLAIDSLVNPPYDARRFKVDQDFLPVGTAPGNGPDLIFEFADFVLVVEVTLTTNSRQEAAEGEPVRRHVANLVIEHAAATGKPVYGLFLANKIDSNTAETFRIGAWYAQDDSKMRLDIIPVTLADFQSFFEALFQADAVDVAHVRTLLDECGNLRAAHEAPAWKTGITRVVASQVAAFNAQSGCMPH